MRNSDVLTRKLNVCNSMEEEKRRKNFSFQYGCYKSEKSIEVMLGVRLWKTEHPKMEHPSKDMR